MCSYFRSGSSIAVRQLAVILLIGIVFTGITGCNDNSSGSNNNPKPPDQSSLPPPPVQVIADAGKARAILRWLPVTDATSFTLYYSGTPGVTKENGTRVENLHSPHTQRDLRNGDPYYFVVASVNEHGEGPVSKEVSATPSDTYPPYAPADVVAESETGQIRVNWSPSENASGYTIYYGTAPGVTPLIGIHAALPPLTIGPLPNGIIHYFVVTANNANGEGAASFEVSAVPLTSPPPAAPAGVTAVEGNGTITLAWSGVTGAASYNVYYATDPGVTPETGIRLADVASPLTINLVNKTSYFLIVTAENENGEGARSAMVSATPLEQTPVPQLVEVAAGPFQMGDNLDDVDYAKPVRTIQINRFYIDCYETTYDQWKTVYDWAVVNGYTFDNAGCNGSIIIQGVGVGTNLPVTSIYWYDAVKWLNARSEKEGRNPVYYTDENLKNGTTVYRQGQVDLTNAMVDWTANGYRLPTEAEWEKAARGGLDGKRYPWGDELGTGTANHNMGRCVSVGIYAPNDYGLYDMAGNVWEWTWDRASDDYTWALGIDNPRGPTEGTFRVRRGGGWQYGPDYLRCFERMFRPPTYVAPYFGFRAASNAP